MNIKRRNFIKAAATTSALSFLPSIGRTGETPSTHSKPNVLLICADQFRAGVMGCAGDPNVKTPNLDRLSHMGVRYERAYANSPICTPSRISLFTGQYPRTHRYYENSAHDCQDDMDTFMATYFRRQGYRTALIGKSHMVGKWDHEGFEHIRYSNLADAPLDNPLQVGYFKYLVENGLGDAFDQGMAYNDPPGTSQIPLEHSLERWIGDQAVDYLSKQERGTPYFLYVSFDRPHEPYVVSPPYDRMYDPEKLELPYSASHEDWGKKPEYQKTLVEKRIETKGQPGTEKELRNYLAHYYGLVSLIDEEIGRILDQLEQRGDMDNTVIVFLSDHGDFAGEHGLMHKPLGMYESIHRVPLLVAYRGVIEEGRVSDQLVELVDVYPNLCRLAGVAVPENVEGDMWIGEEGEAGKEFSVVDYNDVSSIRTRRYRLVMPLNGQGELYDHESDPHELRNLWNDKSHAEVQMELLTKLHLFHMQRKEPRCAKSWDPAAQKPTIELWRGPKKWSQIKQEYGL